MEGMKGGELKLTT